MGKMKPRSAAAPPPQSKAQLRPTPAPSDGRGDEHGMQPPPPNIIAPPVPLTGQHQAGVLHLQALHLSLQEELEVDAFGSGWGGEEARRDASHSAQLGLHEAQVVKDLLSIRLAPIQNLGDAAGGGQGGWVRGGCVVDVWLGVGWM